MKVDRRYAAICEVASTDESRPNLIHMAFDPVTGRLVATNGFAIAFVPAEAEECDSAGAVSVRAFRAAAEDNPGDDIAMETPKGALKTPSGCTFPRPAPEFPDFAQVMPKFKRGDKGTVSFAVNAKLLLDVQQAIGAGRDGVILTVRVKGKEKHEPILIEPNMGRNGAIGAVMPMRIDREASK